MDLVVKTVALVMRDCEEEYPVVKTIQEHLSTSAGSEIEEEQEGKFFLRSRTRGS